MNNPGSERRQELRMQAQRRAYAILHPGFTRVGRIIDVSMGGLSFWYSEGNMPPAEASKVDIYLDISKYLEGIPCKIVYDVQIPKRSLPYPEAARRIGLQFGELTHEQKSKLEYFITGNIEDEA